MKGIKRVLRGTLLWGFGLVLGAVLGCAAGFLRVPTLESANAFWVGAVACLAGVGVVLALVMFWNKTPVLRKWIGAPASPQRARAGTWMLAGLALAGFGAAAWLFRENQALRNQDKQNTRQIHNLTGALDSLRNSQLADLTGNVLDKVDEELRTRPDSSLSPGMIARIAALSKAFQPYRYAEGDSLSTLARSPGRGQLLLALCNMPMDTGSWHQILRAASFEGADLRGADLAGKDLAGIHLKGADLRDARLRGADLRGADLSWARLWGAELDSAALGGSQLKRSVLAWAKLNGADLRLALLNGADLSNAQFRKADLTGASIQWAHAEGAFFSDANLAQADLLGTGLQKANLNGAILVGANLMAVNMNDAHLNGADIADARCGKDLLEKLGEWRVATAAVIKRSFRVVEDLPHKFVSAGFRLERIGK